jgi:hypothetical protein
VTKQRNDFDTTFFVSVFCWVCNLGGLDLFVLDWLSEFELG